MYYRIEHAGSYTDEQVIVEVDHESQADFDSWEEARDNLVEELQESGECMISDGEDRLAEAARVACCQNWKQYKGLEPIPDAGIWDGEKSTTDPQM
jgi:hypothetical protein